MCEVVDSRSAVKRFTCSQSAWTCASIGKHSTFGVSFSSSSVELWIASSSSDADWLSGRRRDTALLSLLEARTGDLCVHRGAAGCLTGLQCLRRVGWLRKIRRRRWSLVAAGWQRRTMPSLLLSSLSSPLELELLASELSLALRALRRMLALGVVSPSDLPVANWQPATGSGS